MGAVMGNDEVRFGIGFSADNTLNQMRDPDTEASIRLGDLVSMRTDMVTARARFERLHLLLSSAEEVDGVLADALFDAAVVAYARPFASGVRKQLLKPRDLVARFADVQSGSDAHENLLLIRNKYIAHSDNHDEQGIAGFLTAPRVQGGEPHYNGVGYYSHRTSRANLEWAAFGFNVSSVWIDVIDQKMVEQRELIAADGRSIDDEAFRRLRLAATVLSADVGRRRRRGPPGRRPSA